MHCYDGSCLLVKYLMNQWRICVCRTSGKGVSVPVVLEGSERVLDLFRGAGGKEQAPPPAVSPCDDMSEQSRNVWIKPTADRRSSSQFCSQNQTCLCGPSWCQKTSQNPESFRAKEQRLIHRGDSWMGGIKVGVTKVPEGFESSCHFGSEPEPVCI